MPGASGTDVAGSAGGRAGSSGSQGTTGSMGTGGINGGAAGGSQTGGGSGAQGGANGGDIAYGSSDDPFAGLGRPGSGGMSTAERRAALDARLEESYGAFDGMIIAEREKAQNEANAAGSATMGSGNEEGSGEGEGDNGEGGIGVGGNLPGVGSVIVANGSGSNAGGGYMPGPGGREGEYASSGPSFPPPADIPSETDDDVVARQLREAAMHEPDPQLREKLWNEYRNYTGLPIPANDGR